MQIILKYLSKGRNSSRSCKIGCDGCKLYNYFYFCMTAVANTNNYISAFHIVYFPEMKNTICPGNNRKLDSKCRTFVKPVVRVHMYQCTLCVLYY